MKKCLNCNLHIGGARQQCPFCNARLVGESSELNWPHPKKLRWQSFLYKLQLFIVLALMVLSISLDFMLELNTGKHWSIPVALWALSLEVLLRYFINKSVVVPAIVTESAIHAMLLLIFTGWYLGFLNPITRYVVPIVIVATLITNFVFSLIDKHGNALIYLLCNIVIPLVPYVILIIRKSVIPITWTICVNTSIITLIGICVFRGRSVLNEIEKRMSI